MNTHTMQFDILVIGAGPAGLSAAQVAVQSGARVGLVDDNILPGGQIWRQGPSHPPKGAARELLDALSRHPNLTRLPGTRVTQPLERKRLQVEDAEQGHVLGYDRLILATGARERFLPYPGWTLPGVTGAGGLQALIKGGTPVAGQRIVLAGSGPLLWASAKTAQEQGAQIIAIVEQASHQSVARFARSLAFTPAKLVQAIRLRLDLRHTPYWCDAQVVAAHGDDLLRGVTVQRPGGSIDLSCDRLACAYGLLPNVELAAALDCASAPYADATAVQVDVWQRTSQPDVYAAGECTGVGGMELSALEGRIAAHAALGQQDAARQLFAERERYRNFSRRLHAAFALNPSLRTLPKDDTLFCRCEDVTHGQIAAHDSWRMAKLHTRCGMGPCQGRICGGAAAFCFGWQPVNTRPPLSPTRIGTLADLAGTDAA
ncbi:MAG: FAD-dependent oxidoreductase [Bordetella sp.]|uniref:FAD-dependent oxidoreductase n=1 Tax=Bordetella sp. TaxID=28081 RepID=UPI003F7CBAA0